MKRRVWVHKSRNFREAGNFELRYYKSLTSAERVEAVQLLREAHFKATGLKFDENGERLGAVVEWKDRTDEVAVEGEIADIVTSAGMGDFTQRIDMSDKEGFFERLAAEQPLLLVFDDLHWMDASSASLLEHLLPLVERVPLLLCGLSRPDQDAPALGCADQAEVLETGFGTLVRTATYAELHLPGYIDPVILLVEVQAHVKPDPTTGRREYRPLVDVGGLPCWPSRPDFDQLLEGEALDASGEDLENWWTTWEDPAPSRTLR